MLTGKCKTDFEQWLIKFVKSNPIGLFWDWANADYKEWEHLFGYLPIQMRSGLYLEFFRERGMSVNVWQDVQSERFNYTVFTEQDYYGNHSPDYSTSFTHAIDKACELYNGKEK